MNCESLKYCLMETVILRKININADKYVNIIIKPLLSAADIASNKGTVWMFQTYYSVHFAGWYVKLLCLQFIFIFSKLDLYWCATELTGRPKALL